MKLSLNDYLSRLKALLQPKRLVVLGEPLEAVPRWGHGIGRHERLYNLLNTRREFYKQQLTEFLHYEPCFEKIVRDRNGDHEMTEPYWSNRFLPPLDAIALYCFIAKGNPANFVEIGSGNSTMFARRAIGDHNLKTRITSFDPKPRAAIDNLCDRVFRDRLERSDLSLFKELGDGDIVFFDGSHYVFQNSDVVVFLLEILQELKPGVIVHLHDIFLPNDYPTRFGSYGWGEQYLIAAYLLGGSVGLEILLPNCFVAGDREISSVFEGVWRKPAFRDLQRDGGSFWMRRI